MSISIILFVIFGGIQSFWGAILGAVVLSVLPQLFSFLQGWYTFLYGLIFVALMLWRPQGIIDRRALAWLAGLVQRP